MRYDCFIIWSHGIKHIADIMCTLRAHFDILFIHRHKIDNIVKFVDGIYSCDSYPLSHLKSKTQYLLKTDPECIFVLVRNNEVHEQMVGKNPFRKKQCAHVKWVKDFIRAKYNTIAEQHVIHGTDYQSQVRHILKVFGLNDLKYYTRGDEVFPWHLDRKPYTTKTVRLDDLRANILGRGYIRIEDTPHYKYVRGDKDEYINYHGKHMGYKLKEDHFPERFDELMLQTDFNPILITRGIILDGVHRASILKSCGYKLIKVNEV